MARNGRMGEDGMAVATRTSSAWERYAWVVGILAAMFLIYLAKLYDLLRRDTDRSRFLGSPVLAGGTLFIALNAVSDIGILGLLGAKLASFGRSTIRACLRPCVGGTRVRARAARG
jgi:hypothetical protein